MSLRRETPRPRLRRTKAGRGDGIERRAGVVAGAERAGVVPQGRQSVMSSGLVERSSTPLTSRTMPPAPPRSRETSGQPAST